MYDLRPRRRISLMLVKLGPAHTHTYTHTHIHTYTRTYTLLAVHGVALA